MSFKRSLRPKECGLVFVFSFDAREGRRARRGAVLVIVLAMIVLLAALIVAYLSRTLTDRQLSNSSFNQSKADELARSALDILTGDLKQEIANGSTNVTLVYPTTGTASFSPIYECTNASFVVPTQNWPGQPTAGALSTLPNLIRISSTTPIAYPGVDQIASNLSTTAVSANGRNISLARWNRHYLLPRPSGASDSTPVTGAGGFTAPSWVVVTTSGPVSITTPSTAVIGRYAYAIYNEGGLLDANVAGYPSTSTTDQVGGKSSSLAYADLSVLTNSVGMQLMTSAQIDQLVGWRNYASTQPAGNFPNFSFTLASATNYFNYFAFNTNNPASFLKISGANGISGQQYNNQTDQAILSRQQLLNLQGTIGFSLDALQYLGTFSREINAPTFYYPNANSTSYPAPSPTNNVTNPNILGYRMSSAGSAPDGFTWNAGDPLIPRRFPLSRLALIAYNAVNTSASSPIYKYFGLYRTTASDPDASKSAWVYTGSGAAGATTAAAHIETLAEVAAETPSREPNFFELLKAAIHTDSMGVWNGDNLTTGSAFTPEGNSDLADNQPDLQILRIGANMIDQADADSYPTVITFSPPVPASVETISPGVGLRSAYPPLYTYGTEDLPYINALGVRCMASNYLPGNSAGQFKDSGASTHKLYDEFVPVLWNPHRSINTAKGPVPASIQLYLTGRTAYVLGGGYMGVTNTANASAPIQFIPTNTNDFYHYGPLTNVLTDISETFAEAGAAGLARYNEMGLGNFSPTLTAHFPGALNTGSIIIPSSAYPTFSQPNMIMAGSGATASGSYGQVPAPYATGVFGLTLTNQVYATGRPAGVIGNPAFTNVTTDFPQLTNGYPRFGNTNFDGYESIAPNTHAIHHELHIGSGGVGLNVVARYQDYNGNYQVYNAFASDEADPNGNINGSPVNYDSFGIIERNDPEPGKASGIGNDLAAGGVPGTVTADGLILNMFNMDFFPTYNQKSTFTNSAGNPAFAPDPNWNIANGTGANMPTGTVPINGQYDQYAVTNPAAASYYFWMKADPRTARFGVAEYTGGSNLTNTIRDAQLVSGNVTITSHYDDAFNGPAADLGYGYPTEISVPTNSYYTTSLYVPANAAQFYFPAMWSQNSTNNGLGTYNYDWNQGHTNLPIGQAQTGMVRPADDYYTGTSGKSGTSILSASFKNTNNIYQLSPAQPVVLNRPFRSVGELGYVYRDSPYKSLDMASGVSVDAALLDYFTVDTAQTPIAAGKVDLNTRQIQVVRSILNGSFRIGDPSGAVAMGPNAASALAASLVAATATTPLGNKAQLVPTFASIATNTTPLSGSPPTGGSTAISVDNSDSSPTDLYPSIKTQREAPIRALADVGNTRTWNLMIDLIAQTGQYPPGSTSLSQFVVTGERRYWLHVAIDRFTGKVVDQQLEPVFE